jgi:hypothetical protein
VVRDLARGRNFLAANLPGCDRAGCYRIDAVTLADRGVVVARGAIGDHPSWVIRRAFGAPRPQFVRIARDPQPDLIPSSAGAAYFALGRGWFRWDFGSAAPAHTPYGIAAPAQPIRYEAGRWYLERRGACGDTILSARAGGSAQTMLSPGVVLGFAGTPRGACATFLALTGTANRPVTTWAVSPEDSHSSEGVTGVITFGTPGG